MTAPRETQTPIEAYDAIIVGAGISGLYLALQTIGLLLSGSQALSGTGQLCLRLLELAGTPSAARIVLAAIGADRSRQQQADDCSPTSCAHQRLPAFAWPCVVG